MKVKKINQSYAYCENQINWLRCKFNSSVKLDSLNKKEIEREFLNKFSIKRSFHSLRIKAQRLGLRPNIKQMQVGITRKKGKSGDYDQILTCLDPIIWTPINRYIWELSTGRKVKDREVVINVNGREENPKIEDLRKITRSQLLYLNKLPLDIPIDTAILLAKIESKSNNLNGRGDWSDEERQWLMRNGKQNGGHMFWVNLAKKFNAKFKKKRTNRDLLMIFYRNVKK